MATRSYDFNGADQDLTATGYFDNIIGTAGWNQESGYGRAAQNDFFRAVAWVSSDPFGSDHFAEFDLVDAGGLNGGFVLRATTDGACYYVRFTGAFVYVYRRDSGGAETFIASPSQSVSAGQKLRASIAGSGATVTIKVWVDGSVVQTITDSSAGRITSGGQPGLYGCRSYGTWKIDNLQLGDGEVPPAPARITDVGMILQVRKSRLG